MKTTLKSLLNRHGQRDNPLQLSIGDTIRFLHEPRLRVFDFTVEKISIVHGTHKTVTRFIDYYLKGNRDINLRLRMQPLTSFIFGSYHAMLLYAYRETKEYRKEILGSEFVSHYDDEGDKLIDPKRYWRVGDKTEPVQCFDAVGKPFVYWDYSRLTQDEKEQEITELVYIENKGEVFTFLRGSLIDLEKGHLT
jgi:hypothetical protein